MAQYKSNYTGAQIDAGIAKANTALQEEQYKGTYSKPSGGIPEDDLSSEVKAKLNAGGSSGGIETLIGTSSDKINLNTLEAGIYYMQGSYIIGNDTNNFVPYPRLIVLTKYTENTASTTRRVYFFGSSYEYNGCTDVQTYLIHNNNGSYSKDNYQKGYFVSSTITGVLSNLTTTTKDTLVDAINEINATSGGIVLINTSDSDSDTISKFESALDTNNCLVKPVYLCSKNADFYLGVGLYDLYYYTYTSSQKQFTFVKKDQINIPYRGVTYTISGDTITETNIDLSQYEKLIMTNVDFNATMDFTNNKVIFSNADLASIKGSKPKIFTIKYTYQENNEDITNNYTMTLSYHDSEKLIYNLFRLTNSSTLQYIELTILDTDVAADGCTMIIKTINI